MTTKGDRIGRLEALLEKIRERSAQPRGMNGVAAGSVAQWAPEDTEIRISTTFEDPETFAAEVAFTAGAVAADGAPAVDEPLPEDVRGDEDGPPRFSDEIVEDGRISDLTRERLSDDYADIQDEVQDEPESFPANMLDEYEVSEDVVEIHVDADDDSVRTSVEVSALDVPSLDVPVVEASAADVPVVEMAPVEVPTVELNEVPSGARLAGGSGVVLSEADEVLANEADVVGPDERISVGVTVEVEETPSSSRRPILEEEEGVPGYEEPPMTPPPASGKQIAAEYSFEDPAAETLHPVGPIESPRRDPLLPTEPQARQQAAADESDLDAPRQIWKATSPPPQVEPETFGAWLDATMSL
ncbi:hypothetical protein LZC95_42560 [Pendulispora brunnea]|uniref:Uncharacterized protein n=1 Tax=Pendulispora brunnea TaxID=2905690 RepID=A0ABZ2K335_9BACT